MDILEILKKDHEDVLLLFDELDWVGERGRMRTARRDKLFEQLRQALEAHMKGEEEIFYPLLGEDENMRPIVQEAREEHQKIRVLLAELDALPKDERWAARIKVLRSTVEYHLEEEEDDLFENAEGVLDGEQRKIMGNLVSAVKDRHLASLTR